MKSYTKWVALGLLAILAAGFAAFAGPRGNVHAQTGTVLVTVFAFCVPTTDPGRFELFVNGKDVGGGLCGFSTRTVTTAPPFPPDVTEQAGSGTNLANYDVKKDCSESVLPTYTSYTCTFTNTRITPPAGSPPPCQNQACVLRCQALAQAFTPLVGTPLPPNFQGACVSTLQSGKPTAALAGLVCQFLNNTLRGVQYRNQGQCLRSALKLLMYVP